MDLTSVKIIKELLSEYDTRASKGLGQNFLINKNVLQKIINAAELKPDDVILEVGPGIGTLTQELAKKARKVIAIEKDKTMCEILKETLAEYKNIEIIQGDVLKFDIFKLISNFKFQISNYKVVANIPYYLTSPLIRKFLESENPPELMVLMLQKEVAQRICAKPPDMSLLSVSVQFYVYPVKSSEAGVSPSAKQFNGAGLKIISYVSKNCFWPSPRVDSAIIKITPLSSRRGPSSGGISRGRASNQLFFKVVKAGFSQPRKQLAGNLAKNLKLDKKEIENWLLKNNIKPNQRAETLSIDDWQNLTNSF